MTQGGVREICSRASRRNARADFERQVALQLLEERDDFVVVRVGQHGQVQ
jgi:hypothetical protein